MARILAHNAANRPVSFTLPPLKSSRGNVQGGETLRMNLATGILIGRNKFVQSLITPHTRRRVQSASQQ